MKKNNELKTKFVLKAGFCFILVLIVLLLLPQYANKSFATNEEASPEFIYLSDLQPSYSKSGYGKICYNQTAAGVNFSIRIEGGTYSFSKGIWAHATSELIYNLSDYQDYAYFTTYMGVNTTSANNGNGVKFMIYTSTSTSGNDWTLQKETPVIKSGNDAIFAKIDIRGMKRLRLIADANGSNGNDHSIYVDSKLIKEGYKEPGANEVPSIEELDEEIKGYITDDADLSNNEEYELKLLQREFISSAGNYALRNFLAGGAENKEVYNWLTNDVENLRLYLVAGKPESGNYLKSLNALTQLYTAHKADLDITERTKYGTVLGDLYKRMMLSISLTHSGNVYLWITGGNSSNPVTRYEIYKKLHSETVEEGLKGAGEEKIQNRIFESLTVEEMRWVMNTVIDDEEIEWLNWYAREKKNGATGPYSYIRYTSGYNYWKAQYYSEENRQKWDDKYNLSAFSVPYVSGNPKLWIVFEEGSVCGGLSKTGSCVWGSYKGLPNTCVSQPGHCAYIYYSQDSNGNGIWGLGNDVSGWGPSGRTEHLNVRTMNDWGNGSYTSGYNASYILLAQAAQNEYKTYEKAEEILMLANIYKNDKEKLAKIYDAALEVEPINFDAWLGKINLYASDATKTDEDYYALAEEIANTLTYYPRPMYDLLVLIEGKVKSVSYKVQLTLLKTRTLTLATKATSNQTIQGTAVKQVANYLLGLYDKNIATFSFDGANAGAIVLGSRYQGTDVQWDYSLDGGNTWTDTGEKICKLTTEEIESITAGNDIKIHIIGVGYSQENIYTIDITEQSPWTVFANDLENRMIGVGLTTEWRYSENDDWTSYSVRFPDLTGNKTVQIRQAATGTRMASSASTYTFTEDNQPNTRKYIPISHLSVHSFSTEAASNAGAAVNAIDGNYNTRWHSAWNGTDGERYFVIKLDEPVYLSAVEFVPSGGGNGKIYDGTIYGSMDGEEWEVLTSKTGITYNTTANTIQEAISDTKSFDIAEPKKVQYVKIKADRTNGNWFTARAFNLFQDITKNPSPTAGIAYNVTQPTNGSVVARLVNPSTQITITNNDGNDTYIFTENGTFTFEFKDKNGIKGTVTANVTWIDKSMPEADVAYKKDDSNKLVILLDNITEDVYLLDKDNNKINFIELDENGNPENISYLDSSGEAYKIVSVDENGVINKITYKNTISSISKVYTYSTIIEDGQIVGEEYIDLWGNTVTLTEEEQKTLATLQQPISNPLEYTFNESGDYEFKFMDKANNIAYKSIKADYLEDENTILASDITYNITKTTNKNVVATIKPYIINTEGEIVVVEITNNGGNSEYTFTDNGEFTFEYRNSSGGSDSEEDNSEVREHTARVNWIDKTAPTAEIKYSTKELTANQVVATLINESEEIVITNNGASREYIFTENGEFTFEFEDEAGNKATAKAEVNWIDKTAPTAEIKYSTKEPTTDKVVATLINESEEIVITNNDASREYIFTENGEFVFEFKDKAGNKGTVTAKVDWIDKTAPTAEIKYSTKEPTTDKVVATLINESEEIVVTNNGASREYIFTENGEFVFEFKDKAGNKGTATAKVDWIKKEQENPTQYQLGDVNQDGKITATDLLLIKRHLVAGEKQEWILTQNRFKAGDINEDGKITATDLILIKRLVLKQMEI